MTWLIASILALLPPFSQLFGPNSETLRFFDKDSKRTPERQERHTVDCARMLESNLKLCLEALVEQLFGTVEKRWVETSFPFTHPSWELEIRIESDSLNPKTPNPARDWMEVLGCGIVEQRLLANAGAGEKAGWAFGLGLERLAMRLYDIPDIRLFWSKDSGFTSQFAAAGPNTSVKFKPFSRFPQLFNDVSFWLPGGGAPEGKPGAGVEAGAGSASAFCDNDFYDLVRDIGGEMVEQVFLIDSFRHPKTGRSSRAFRLVYRHMDRTLTQAEVTAVHRRITAAAAEKLGVEIR